MVGTPQEMRALATELSMSVWTLSAIGVMFESGLVEQLKEPRSVDELAAGCKSLPRSRIERCLSVAATGGVVIAEGERYRLAAGVMPFLQQPMRAALLGDIRSSLMQPLAFLDASNIDNAPNTGWRHTDRALLQAQGDASGAFPPMFKANLIASMGDLSARLERPGARFLDIGVGVGSLAISMCRIYPHVHVVGIDMFDAPLAIAREKVAAAGLTDRIELRQMVAEDLTDEAAFDLAWLPSVFVPQPVLEKVVARVRASLRPGGWMLFPVMGDRGDQRQRAVWSLMNDLWGGPVLSSADSEALLKKIGLSSVQTMPGPSWSPGLIVGQR